jgi:hypothetical protein
MKQSPQTLLASVVVGFLVILGVSYYKAKKELKDASGNKVAV